MDNRKHIAIISLAGPPKSGPESLQTGKIVKYLNKSKYDLTFVTEKVLQGQAGGWNICNPELLIMLEGVNNIIRINALSSSYYRFFFRNIIPSLFYKPDPSFFFHFNWKNILRKLTKCPDVIYSRSTPFSSAIAARKIKEKTGCKWIMHMSDPWTESPLFQIPNRYKGYHEKEENACFFKADVITMTSNKTIELYKRKYPYLYTKFQYFPNVYDDDHLAVIPRTPSSQLKWVYTGNMYGDRTPLVLFKALKKIEKKNKNILDSCMFVFAGHADVEILELFEKYKSSYIRYVGPLSFEKARELQNDADILIAIDSPVGGDKAVFFPSKLLDYFVARKPVFAITGPDSTTSEVLDEKYNFVVGHNETEKIAAIIMNIITAHKERNYSLFHTPMPNPFYSASFNAKRLEHIFDIL